MRYSDEGGMTSSKQEKILKRFREGEFNVLVGTSVIEEGLDVRKCSLVVKFDGVDNYREYVQSKGRARAENSKYVVFAEQSMVVEVENNMEVLTLYSHCFAQDALASISLTSLTITDIGIRFSYMYMFNLTARNACTRKGLEGKIYPKETRDTISMSYFLGTSLVIMNIQGHMKQF